MGYLSRWRSRSVLGISGPKAIAEYGVDRFNEAARSVVQANTENWEVLTERIGRWVDFDNDYKTLDPEFMETVWWVFKQLWDKGLVYKDFKVLPYSWGAATPLSNFEANKDYRDVEDPSITVRLEVLEDAGPVDGRRLPPDLDNHPMDPSWQPGRGRRRRHRPTRSAAMNKIGR